MITKEVTMMLKDGSATENHLRELEKKIETAIKQQRQEAQLQAEEDKLIQRENDAMRSERPDGDAVSLRSHALSQRSRSSAKSVGSKSIHSQVKSTSSI